MCVSQLVLEHLEAISPDHNDLLHELLQDLGDAPDVAALLGTTHVRLSSSPTLPSSYTPSSNPGFHPPLPYFTPCFIHEGRKKKKCNIKDPFTH